MVDDDADWLLLMQGTLKAQGLQAVASVNGEGLWEKISQYHPDVILMDIAMKGPADGESLCRQIKTNDDTSHIPLILLSSNTNIAIIAARCGADSYIPKSAPASVLKKEIEILLHAA